ncbi:MAG: dihydrofolate reductase [Bacteroidetes bacterium]|nr:dihydrofolate reductase [Bacteroidota bacterium]
MSISIIVAVAENNVIGKNNSLIWHLPADMKFFKEKTTGHCVITGRKNYESIPEKFRPLPNRTNIIITHQKNYNAPGAIIVGSIEEAIKKAEQTDDKEIFIIGGAEIFKQTMHLADTIYYTKIYHLFEGDTFFPELKQQEWQEFNRTDHHADEKNKYRYSFIEFKKKL